MSKPTKFKLLCIYSHKLDGTLFTQSEKNAHKNIELYNSVDCIIMGSNGLRIRHDLAYLKFIEHIYKKWIYIDTCKLFMFDFESKRKIQIGNWDKLNFSNNKLCELILEKQNLNVLCLGAKFKNELDLCQQKE